MVRLIVNFLEKLLPRKNRVSSEYEEMLSRKMEEAIEKYRRTNG